MTVIPEKLPCTRWRTPCTWAWTAQTQGQGRETLLGLLLCMQSPRNQTKLRAHMRQALSHYFLNLLI